MQITETKAKDVDVADGGGGVSWRNGVLKVCVYAFDVVLP